MKTWQAFFHLCAYAVLGSGILLGGISAYCFDLYQSERTILRNKAESIVQDVRADRELSLTKLNEWVYYNKGFRKNPYFFLYPALGPTPSQVMEHGGDCADKSRLLSAMLYEIGIDNTLVVLYSKTGLKPTHTIVETREENFVAAADPVFNIVFPDEHGRLLGVRELRESNNILENRLKYLSQNRSPGDKINFYRIETETYDFPRTINWDKNILTRAAGRIIGFLAGDIYLTARPRFLENPYLLAFTTTIVSSIILLVTGVAMLFVVQKRHRRHAFSTRLKAQILNL
jgi:hypothetical protein